MAQSESVLQTIDMTHIRKGFRILPSLETPILVGVVFITTLQSIALLYVQDLLQLKINLVLQLSSLIIFAFWSFKKSGTYLSPPFIFVLSIYFWHSTFLTGYYFDLSELFEYSGNIFTYGETFVPKASVLVALGISLAILGSLYGFFQKKKMKKTSQVNINYPNTQTINSKPYFGKTSTQLAWLSFLGFILISVIYFIFEGTITFEEDYFSLYTDTSGSFLFRFFHAIKFFGVIVILAIFASSKKKKDLVVCSIMTAGLIFINILMGSRSMPFIYALAFLISIDAFFKRIPLKFLIIIAIFASAISYVIDSSRVYGLGLSVLNFSQTGKSIDFIHIFWNAGGTIQTVLRTLDFSVESGFLYGQSFIDALIYLLPRAIVDGLGLSTGFTPPSVWLVENSSDIPEGGGMGYSMVAEAYLNFGITGCLLFAIVGWVLANRYYDYVFNQNRFSVLHAFNIAIIFSLHMRNDVGSYLRFLFYGFIFIELLRVIEQKSVSINFSKPKNKFSKGSKEIDYESSVSKPFGMS